MKNGNDIIKFNTVVDPGILSAFADVYQKMQVQNQMVLKLVEILRENHLITYGQAHDILLLTLDQISDPEEREEAKKEIEREFTLKIQRMSDEEKKKMIDFYVDTISEFVNRRRKNDR